MRNVLLKKFKLKRADHGFTDQQVLLNSGQMGREYVNYHFNTPNKNVKPVHLEAVL